MLGFLEQGTVDCQLLLLDDADDVNVPTRIKRMYCNVLQKLVIKTRNFHSSTGTSLTNSLSRGSHSLRTYPATFARTMGASPDDIDIRGC
jgi:hypothetical protein